MKTKKMAAFAMASVLAMTAAVPALAAESTVTSAAGTSRQYVYAYTEKDSSAYNTAVNVTVNWTSANGAYSVSGDSYTWIPASGTTAGHYTKSAGGTVTKKSEPTMTITLTNNSDVYEDYSIGYQSAAGFEAIAQTAAEGSNTSGTLASYTAVNAVTPETAGATTASTNMADKNTASYTGTFTTDETALTEAGKVSGGATITAGTYTVTLSASSGVNLSYTNMGGSTMNAKDLIDSGDTVEYTDPYTGNTNIAYNGYIYASSGSTRYDAMSFVQMLNENGVVPSEGAQGTWRLLNSENDALAWWNASQKPVKFGNVTILRTSVLEYGNRVFTPGACEWGYAAFDGYSDVMFGFLVIWAPTAASSD